MELSYKYVIQCRKNTIGDITPSDIGKQQTEDYLAVIELGKKYIVEAGLNAFSGNLQGDQYFVALWTAHIIYDYGNPDFKLRSQCIEIIKDYSDNPLSPKVSLEEKEWLKTNIIP